MQPKLDELRRDGVAVARTAEGFELPVLDVTHPRFALPEDEISYARLLNELLATERRNRRVPRFIMRWMLKSAAKQSRIVRAMFGSNADFLDGLSTYVMKLGSDNLLPPYDTPMDRRFLAAPHATFMRLRTQQVAGLLARHLAGELVEAEQRPLHLINIAGGPAVDSLNALILLAHDTPRLLDRKIVIHVLDRDEAGPFFGANALAALRAEGGRLHGLDITFERVAYDWNDTASLRQLLDEMRADNAIIAASSEGGLFEYGSDEAIVANLDVLRSGGVCCVAGSVTRSAEQRRDVTGADRFKVIPRGLEAFGRLAGHAGFVVAESRPVIFSDQVLLQPA